MLKSALDILEEAGKVAVSGNEYSIMFSTILNKSNGARYSHWRIGRKLAEKAGIALGDGVMFYADKNTRQGMLKVVPYVKGKAWKLQTGDIKLGEKPPLVLRITWREGFPSISGKALCTDVVAGNREIKFKYPKGTSFDKLAELGDANEDADACQNEPEDELYEKHKEIIKKEERVSKKQGNGTHSRRQSDKAPEWKDGKPYGRRASDH